MSVMSELVLDIQLDLEAGLNPRDIARRLDIPITWEYEAAELMDPDDEPDFEDSEIWQ